ncbi:nucleotide sugar dehydrogenase [Aeromicrobium fastidiosum]|uniref:Nucleotide sugar dehydrogenase n=1 Tax=Aeromicrobium fastidiosum TaxID=52699 RepID=A0A641AUK9_9ACTN|nr:nucleotide sugar dehydrogenase [Aeromicrobium fastidiosum]KAA1380691.1 nucleotide sugar dehydrogenase [Aeromicrobium fastidiosum]MBP2390303.1 nucleotide sugar dehydrogenase [Aeromicrobium fastidiosum]
MAAAWACSVEIGGSVKSHAVVIGMGYVGLPLAMNLVESGLSVVGYDTDAGVVESLNAGSSHVDDVKADAVRRALQRGFRASSDPSEIIDATEVIVCVPTPLDVDGQPDLRHVEAAARAIGQHVRPGALCVLESTIYPGTTEKIFAPLVSAGGLVVGSDVFVAFSPERIDPGNPEFGIRNTPKVVAGMTQECTRRARSFYEQIVSTVVEARGTREAEMAKLLENSFRHVNIALVNELLRLCNELEIDLWDVIRCAETKPFGFMAFRPGPGVGGHCIPVDPGYLRHHVRKELGSPFRMLELAEEVNAGAPRYVVERVQRMLNDASRPVKGSSLLLVGVTYKPDVADCRETPAAPIARRLADWGAAVRFHDPLVESWSPCPGGEPALQRVDDVYVAAAEADLVVLLQPHAEYDLERLAGSSVLLLDTSGRVQQCTAAVQRL